MNAGSVSMSATTNGARRAAAVPHTPLSSATGVGSAAACTSGGTSCDAAGRSAPDSASNSITVDITPGQSVHTNTASSSSRVWSGSREARRVNICACQWSRVSSAACALTSCTSTTRAVRPGHGTGFDEISTVSSAPSLRR